MTRINKLRSEMDTLSQLVYIRHSIDTNDEFYKAEQDFFDENGPVIQEYITDYYRALVDSKFRAQLEDKWGRQLFQLAELSLKTFSPEIIEDLQQENKLTTEYSKLIASAKIQFEGEERTLSQLIPFSNRRIAICVNGQWRRPAASWLRTKQTSTVFMTIWLK